MASISTQDLAGLPNADTLKQLFQSLATLDAVISMDDGGNYDFRSRWGRNQQVAIVDDGCGDHLFAYFNQHGCFIKGFAHESEMSPYQHNPPKTWAGILDQVPSVFDSALNEPAFMIEDTTFAIWQLIGETEWIIGDIQFPQNPYGDGSEEILSMLDGNPNTYTEWAAENFEVEIDVQCVEEIYKHEPLTSRLLHSLNPNATMGKLKNCLVRIGYPVVNAG